MPGTSTVTPRPICLEDLYTTAQPGVQQTLTVLGVGAIALTAIPITLLTQLVVATGTTTAQGDSQAALAGVPVGNVYIWSNGSGAFVLRTRMA